MRLLILCLAILVSFASATFYDADLDQGPSEVVNEFWVGMSDAPSLATIHPEFAEEVKQIESDVKGQIAEALRETLQKILGNFQDVLKRTKDFTQALLKKAEEMLHRLKEVTGTSEELQEKIRDRIRDWLKNVAETLSQTSQNYELIRVPLISDKRGLMEVVKQNILDKLNVKELLEYIKSKLPRLGELGEILLKALHRPDALQNLRNLIEVLLPGRNPDYGLLDIWKKVKDFFQGLGVKISDKFFQFSNWVKDLSSKGWEKITDKAGKLKELTKTVIEKGSTMSKQVAEQALQFFHDHKEEIGSVLWNLVKGALTKAIISAG